MKGLGVVGLGFFTGNSFANSPRNVCLTIDDGPGRYMEGMLDKLGYSGENPVIFYLVGNNIEKNNGRSLAKLAIMNGHLVGNHSYSHRSFVNLPNAEQRQEIDRTEKLISEVYDDVGMPCPVKLFRFPGGRRTDYAQKYLADLGYRVQGWTHNTEDWMLNNRDAENTRTLSQILDNSRRTPDGAVVLAHEREATLDNVLPIYLDKRNFKLVLNTSTI